MRDDVQAGCRGPRRSIDDLLADLDTALEVRPSPSVVTRVRANIDAARARRGIRLQWALAAGTLVLVATVGFVVWSRPAAPASPAPLPAPVVASVPSPSASPVADRISPTPERSPSRHAPPARVTPADAPEVLVAPGVAAALARLNQAVADGHVVASALATTGQNDPLDLTPLPLTPVTIQMIQIDKVPLDISIQRRSS